MYGVQILYILDQAKYIGIFQIIALVFAYNMTFSFNHFKRGIIKV